MKPNNLVKIFPNSSDAVLIDYGAVIKKTKTYCGMPLRGLPASLVQSRFFLQEE